MVFRIEDELDKRGIGQDETAHHEGEEESYKYITMNRYSVKNIVSKLTNGESVKHKRQKGKSQVLIDEITPLFAFSTDLVLAFSNPFYRSDVIRSLAFSIRISTLRYAL